MNTTAPTSPPVPAELPIGDYACLIGLDWGHSKHATSLQPRDPAAATEKLELTADPESVHQWLETLRERFAGQTVAVAVEASKGPIVEILLGHSWIVVYPIHPATSRRFSKAFTPSGAANDQPDADNLRGDPALPPTPAARALLPGRRDQTAPRSGADPGRDRR